MTISWGSAEILGHATDNLYRRLAHPTSLGHHEWIESCLRSAGHMHFRNDKFMISCPARSGSSMLCSLIHSHPQAICHHEVFAFDGQPTVMGVYARKRRDDPEFERQLRKYRDERPEAFLYDIVFDSQRRRCVGFKFKTDEALQPAYRGILDLIVTDKDIKIVHLVRAQRSRPVHFPQGSRTDGQDIRSGRHGKAPTESVQHRYRPFDRLCPGRQEAPAVRV